MNCYQNIGYSEPHERASAIIYSHLNYRIIASALIYSNYLIVHNCIQSDFILGSVFPFTVYL